MLCLQGFVCFHEEQCFFRIEHSSVDAQNMAISLLTTRSTQTDLKLCKKGTQNMQMHANASCVRDGNLGFMAVSACVKVKCNVYHRGS